MITTKNFEDLLKTLEFETEGNTYQKSIGEATLKVDFDNKIYYPEDQGLTVERDDICNLKQNENFVVFECVYQLLKKGYKPEHLELEPKWKVGHGASGGRADILVRDQEKNPLLLIECKTAGEEFERAWRKTLQNGDQLFSYAQQIPQTQYLCLYASDLLFDKNSGENNIRTDQRIIAHRDNKNILDQNESLRPFADATDVEDRYAIWCDTYEREYTEDGIFEPNIQPYQIGKNKYTLEVDTKPTEAADAKKDGKIYKFQTILRQHNIARREQAFEVLVNLFLCKLVDEEDNKTDLQFSWKGIAYDNYFDFVDRLQNLYKTGMNKFLGKEISYISNKQIDDAFWAVRNDTNATKKQIQDYFRELKYYTNSAFSLMDTHNEEFFKRNAKVLLVLVQMWQRIRLKTDEQNQFLGEMFELFLDDGVKQSEGQFFTPLPICKFIVGSLPLAEKIDANPEPLKVIDYACGSGHFLNEYAYQIKQIKENNKIDRKIDLNNYYANITGIEKEDRLAKVAKVAAYMHGQDQIKILDIDALADRPEIKKESFDVLVANPPFSVDGFIHTLSKDDKKQYQLTQYTSEKSDDIQCFFLERIYHLMAPGGIVGVIVPYSILSNVDAVFFRTREILLQYFDLVSIAQLGSGTFGETGTNTVVLFLKRKEPRPEPADQYCNRVKNFFEGDEEKIQYQDHDLIQAYCKHIEIPYEEYIKLFAQTNLEPLSDLLEHDIFKDYEQAFSQSTDIKNLKKSNVFKKKTPTEQSEELAQRLIDYLHTIEKDKLYYFMLAHTQAGKVLIVNAPKKEQDKFLGYWWSKRKGNEGIQYIGGDTVNDIVTPLFDPKNLDDDTKINTAIKRNFIGETTDELPDHCHYANLPDMLDFSRIKFNKAINLNPKQNIDIETQWELVKLGEMAEIVAGQSPKSEFYNQNQEGLPFYQGKKEFGEIYLLEPTVWTEQVTKQSIKNDILMSVRAPVGNVNINPFDKICIGRGLAAIRVRENVLQNYLFNFLDNNQSLFTGHEGMSFDSISTSDELPEIKIPLPPLEVQQQIVDECDAADQETDEARQTITDAKQTIEEKVQAIINSGHEMKKLEDIAEELVAGGDAPKNNFSQIKTDKFNIPIFANGVEDKGLYGYTDIAKIQKPSITISARGTLGYTEVRNEMFYPIVRLIVLTPNVDLVNIFYLKHVVSRLDFTDSGSVIPQLTVPKVRILQIPVPPLNIQQQLVAEVEQLEAKITEAQAVLDNATDRKNTILTTHL